MAFDFFLPKNAMDPESIKPSLLDDDNRKTLSRSRLRLVSQLGKSSQQAGDIAGLH